MLDRSLATRASLRLKVSPFGAKIHPPPLVTLVLSGPKEVLILVWWHLEGTFLFYVYISIIVVRNKLRFPPAILAWEAFQKVTLITPQVAVEASKILMVRRGCQSGMPSGLPLVHFQPLLVVEVGGSSMSHAWLRDRLSLARKEKLWYKICLHPHPVQGGTLPVESRHWSLSLFSFFSLTDGS